MLLSPFCCKIFYFLCFFDRIVREFKDKIIIIMLRSSLKRIDLKILSMYNMSDKNCQFIPVKAPSERYNQGARSFLV